MRLRVRLAEVNMCRGQLASYRISIQPIMHSGKWKCLLDVEPDVGRATVSQELFVWATRSFGLKIE